MGSRREEQGGWGLCVQLGCALPGGCTGMERDAKCEGVPPRGDSFSALFSRRVKRDVRWKVCEREGDD